MGNVPQWGWPRDEVWRRLGEVWGVSDAPGGRRAQIWSEPPVIWVDSESKLDPVVVTAVPQHHDIARLAGCDVAFLPVLMGRPPARCEDESLCRDWWLLMRRDLQALGMWEEDEEVRLAMVEENRRIEAWRAAQPSRPVFEITEAEREA